MSAAFLVAIAISTASIGPISPPGYVRTMTDGITYPARIAPTPSGGIYVTDPPMKLFVEYSSAGALVGSHSIPEGAVGIAVHTDGRIFISRNDGKIGLYSTTFALLGTVNPLPLTLTGPNDLAFDATTNKLYTVDSEAHRVLVFSETALNTWTLSGSWGMEGSGLGKFATPQAIALNTALGQVFVTDADNFRIQVFTTDGVLLFKFGYRTLFNTVTDDACVAAGAPWPCCTGWRTGTCGSATQTAWFARSEGVAVDPCGNIYVSDALMGTVRAFALTSMAPHCEGGTNQWATCVNNSSCPGGTCVTTTVMELSPTHTPLVNYGTGAGELREPCDLAIDGTKMYIANTNNGAVEVYTVGCTAVASASMPTDASRGPRKAAQPERRAADGRTVVTPAAAGQLRMPDNPVEIVTAINSGEYCAEFDFNRDGLLDLADLEIAVATFGAGTVEYFLNIGDGVANVSHPNLSPPHILDLPNRCGLCHSMDGAPAGGMLAAAGQENLCQSCHSAGKVAGDDWIGSGDSAMNHPWDELASNANPGPAPDSELQLHLDAGKVRCATCHDPHEGTQGACVTPSPIPDWPFPSHIGSCQGGAANGSPCQKDYQCDITYIRATGNKINLCAQCHGEFEQWESMGHGEELAEPWVHYDWSMGNNWLCTGPGTPYAYCTDVQAGTATSPATAVCTGPGTPLACCTGVGVGFCSTPAAACTGVGTPWACCTGPGAGSTCFKNAGCTGSGAPWACCTGSGTGSCSSPDAAPCTGGGLPWSCCTGAGTGSCVNTSCTGSGAPWACCTGVGTGTCSNAACTSGGTPWTCCTGPGAGSTCTANSGCLGAGNPWACCAGVGIGTCSNSLAVAVCTGAGTPFSCCTGRGTGPNCTVTDWCTGAGTPWPCCTGAGAGNCANANADCTGAGTPRSCCTGVGAGTCSTNALSAAACTGAGTPMTCCTDAGMGSCSSREACRQCHSGNGYIDFTNDFPDGVVNTATHRGQFRIPDCLVCHATHGEAQDHSLLRVYDHVRLPTGQTVPLPGYPPAGPGATCMSCHNGRSTGPSSTTSVSTPHYLNGAAMLEGINAVTTFPTGTGAITYTLSNSNHTTNAGLNCTTCHMAPGPTSGPEVGKVGGHTFRMMDPVTDFDNVSACNAAGCHTLTTFDRTANGDYDGDGAIDGVQTETTGLLELLKDALYAAGASRLLVNPDTGLAGTEAGVCTGVGTPLVCCTGVRTGPTCADPDAAPTNPYWTLRKCSGGTRNGLACNATNTACLAAGNPLACCTGAGAGNCPGSAPFNCPGGGTCPQTVPTGNRTATVINAIWNWEFVDNSGDLGVHNTGYAIGLLQIAYKGVAGNPVPNFPMNAACTGAATPWACCTGLGTGTCWTPSKACTGAGAPLACCTGAGAGTCTMSDLCTGAAAPWVCCTGLGTGTCPTTAYRYSPAP